MKIPLKSLFLAIHFLGLITLQAADKPPVKVFILTGQSNMEGKAPNELFEFQAESPKTRDAFAHLRKDGKWIEREDVFIKFFDRKGPLTLGYGSPGRTGVELEFGTVMGNHFEEPVLLLKVAWGGRSLTKDFRTPSAGYPEQARLDKELEDAQARITKSNQERNQNQPLPTLDDLKAEYGTSYRQLIAEVRDLQENLGEHFPSLKGHRVELAGLVWFQGWNDQYGGQDEYGTNLKHLIHDLRKDLGNPQLPIVIAAMGQNGSQPAKGAMLTIQTAQLAVNDVPEWKHSVRAIATDHLVDRDAEALYPTWKENQEAWKQTGGDHPYHYLGSALWFTRIGHAMGESMLELLQAPQS